jgi:hypothetical protein
MTVKGVRVYNTEFKTFPDLLWASTVNLDRVPRQQADGGVQGERYCAEPAAGKILIATAPPQTLKR